jgi:hypothetical protein
VWAAATYCSAGDETNGASVLRVADHCVAEGRPADPRATSPTTFRAGRRRFKLTLGDETVKTDGTVCIKSGARRGLTPWWPIRLLLARVMGPAVRQWHGTIGRRP